MSDLTLYHASPSRSSVVLWMLEEVGAPYDIKLPCWEPKQARREFLKRFRRLSA